MQCSHLEEWKRVWEKVDEHKHSSKRQKKNNNRTKLGFSNSRWKNYVQKWRGGETWKEKHVIKNKINNVAMLRRMVVVWRKWEDDRICWIVGECWYALRWLVCCARDSIVRKFSLVCAQPVSKAVWDWSKFTDHLSDYFNFVTARKLIYRHTTILANTHAILDNNKLTYTLCSWMVKWMP